LWPSTRSTVPLLSQSSRTRRLLRLVWLPLLLLAVVPLLVTEVRRPLFHNALRSAIADVIYLGHGAFGLAHGHIPYMSGFMSFPDQHITYLYPPLTLLITMPPVLAGSYFTAGFSLEILILVLAGALILGWVCRNLGMTPYVGLAAAVILLAVGPVLLTRVDAVQGLLVAGAALALTQRRATTAVLLVSLAVLVKETAVPAALPVVLWCLLPEPGQAVDLWKRVGKVIAGALPAVAIFTFFLVWSRGAELTAALASVHRGLEIESVPASVAILLSRLVPVHPYFGHLASWQLRAADAGLLASAATVVGVVAVIGARSSSPGAVGSPSPQWHSVWRRVSVPPRSCPPSTSFCSCRCWPWPRWPNSPQGRPTGCCCSASQSPCLPRPSFPICLGLSCPWG